MTVTAILLAGGAGTRIQQSTNKVYLPIGDRPLLRWPLESLLASPVVDEVVLVIRSEDADHAHEAIGAQLMPRLRAVVCGGPTRHASEAAGLEAIASDIEAGTTELVLMHDAARPFVTADLLQRVVETAQRVGGAVPALSLEPAVARVEEGHLNASVRVDHVRRVQTPQAFAARPLLAAYRAAATEGFHGSDTAESVLRYSSVEVATVEGDPDNVKVTFVEDLFYAEELVGRWPFHT